MTSDHSGSGLVHSIPGFEYEHEPIGNQLEDTTADDLIHIGLTLPLTTIGRFKPTNPASWLVRNVVLATALALWLFMVGWIFIVAGWVCFFVESSWRDMRER